jgi:hypothetical protein
MLAIFILAVAIVPQASTAGAAPPSQELQELDRALSRSEADPEVSAALAEKLLGAWALRDPASAISYALSDDHTHAVFLLAAGNVMEAWARRDPVAARMFFEQLGEMPAGFIAPSLLQGYGSQAPESALEWIHTGVSSEKLRCILARSVVGTYESARRIEEIKLWLSLAGVAAAPEGATAAAELARRVARRNPESAIDFCQSLPPDSAARLAAFQETTRQWATGDPQACRAWLSNLRSPNQATPGKFSPADVDQIIAGFMNGVAGSPPGDAMELLSAITDPALRSHLSTSPTSKP